MIRRVRIEKLAPTGEGIARTAEGVGFVAVALPGEDVEAEVGETKKRFWFGQAVSILSASPLRCAGPHAGCAGCDWAHLEPGAAREAKPGLFLETMERIGELDSKLFGELSIAGSPPAYRIRSRFHVAGKGAEAVFGFHAPGTHRVAPADSCEALTDELRSALPVIRQAVGSSGVEVAEFATLETLDAARRIATVRLAERPVGFGAGGLAASLSTIFEGVRVRGPDGSVLERHGPARLPMAVEGRVFEVSADSFFQVNRHLASRLYADVRAEAAVAAPGRALDAYSGVGFFAGALFEAGHRVVSIEESALAAEDAERNSRAWATADRWQIERSPVDRFFGQTRDAFDVVVADPPRAGLGLRLAREVAVLTRRRLIYVSCDPATLARDLAVLLEEGLAIAGAKLYDLFAFTHRVEAMIVLERRGAA